MDFLIVLEFGWAGFETEEDSSIVKRAHLFAYEWRKHLYVKCKGLKNQRENALVTCNICVDLQTRLNSLVLIDLTRRAAKP